MQGLVCYNLTLDGSAKIEKKKKVYTPISCKH